MASKRRKYSGMPFPKTAYARIYPEDGGDDSTPFPEFWYEGGTGGMLTKNEPDWIATYRLVSVRKLVRVERVVKAR